MFYTSIYHFHLFNHSKSIRIIILYFFKKRKQHTNISHSEILLHNIYKRSRRLRGKSGREKGLEGAEMFGA